MQNSHSWEANTSSASQEIPPIFYNLKVHYRIHKSSPHVPILSQILPAPFSPSHFLKSHFHIILSFTPRSSKLSLFINPHPTHNYIEIFRELK